MSRLGKNIRVLDKSTSPGFAEGKEVCVMSKKDNSSFLPSALKVHVGHSWFMSFLQQWSG